MPQAPAPTAAKPLDSFLKGANMENFGDDDNTPNVQAAPDRNPLVAAAVAQVKAKKPIPPGSARTPRHTQPTTTPTAPAASGPAATDFGEDDDPDADDAPAVLAKQQADEAAKKKAEEASKPAEKPGGQQQPPPGLHTHPPELLAAARQYGFSNEECALYSGEELKREVFRLRREKPAEAPKPAAVPEPVIDWGTHDSPDGDGTKRPWTDDDISPAIAHALKAQAKQIAELSAALRNVSGAQQRQEVAPVMQRVRAEVAKYGEFFGNANPAQGTPEHDRCRMIMVALDEMAKNGHPADPEKDVPAVIERLFGRKAGEQPPKPAEKPDPEVERAKKGFKEGTVNKPTARNTPELPQGEERARKAVAEKLRSKGIEPEYGPGDDDTAFE